MSNKMSEIKAIKGHLFKMGRDKARLIMTSFGLITNYVCNMFEKMRKTQ